MRKREHHASDNHSRQLILWLVCFWLALAGPAEAQLGIGGAKPKTRDQINAAASSSVTEPNEQGGDWWGSPTIADGAPAVQVGREVPGSNVIVITIAKYGEERAFRFPFLHMHGASTCQGYFYITPTRLVYAPVNHDQDALNLLRSDNPSVYPGRYGTGSFLIVYGRNMDFFPNWDHSVPFLTWKDFQKDDPDKSHYKAYEKKAYDEANHDAEVFRAWWWKAYTNFADAEKKFREITANASVPLSAEQKTALMNEQSLGDAAVQADQSVAALQHYLAALQTLPTQWAPVDTVGQLDEKVIKVVARMNPRPTIPEEANRHYSYALAAIEDAKSSADPSKVDEGINQLNQALRLAPWWPEAYYNLGLILETRERYAEASRNLKLYLLAAPSAPDATAVQQKIYQLEYKSGAR